MVLLALAERAYPRKLAFAYLADCHRALAAEMAAEYGPGGARAAIDTASKPYSFMKFGAHGSCGSGKAGGGRAASLRSIGEVASPPFRGLSKHNVQSYLSRDRCLDARLCSFIAAASLHRCSRPAPPCAVRAGRTLHRIGRDFADPSNTSVRGIQG